MPSIRLRYTNFVRPILLIRLVKFHISSHLQLVIPGPNENSPIASISVYVLAPNNQDGRCKESERLAYPILSDSLLDGSSAIRDYIRDLAMEGVLKLVCMCAH